MKSQTSPNSTASFTPRQRVRAYLEKDFLSKDSSVDRLPPIVRLADHLKVSVPTVRTVVREFAAEGRVVSTQGRGTFVVRKAPEKELVIGTNVRWTSANEYPLGWGDSIFMGAVKMAASLRPGLSIRPMDGTLHREDMHRCLLKQRQKLDMLMLFPGQRNDELRKVFEDEGKPVVEINPPALSITANFVSADYFRASYRVGRAWYLTGRRHIIYVGWLDGDGATDLRLAGLARGCGGYEDDSVRFKTYAAELDGKDEKATEDAMRKAFAKNGEHPDAIYCVGDCQAGRVLALLESWGIDVPGAVSVVSGTGLPDGGLSNSGQTRILQPMKEIGANAVRMLNHRYANGCVSMPGIYLEAPIYCGSTTRDEENKILAGPATSRPSATVPAPPWESADSGNPK